MRLRPLIALLLLLAPALATAQVRTERFPMLRDLPVEDPRSYGARGNGSADDTAEIQRAIDRAAARGSSPLGAEVRLAPGNYIVTAPLIVPKATSSATGIVHLVGESPGTVTITGSGAGFIGRGVIEITQSTAQTWSHRFENLRVIAPNQAGAMCFYFPANQAALNASTVPSEWVSRCVFRNLELWGNTDYQSNGLMNFDIGARFSTFEHITGNIALGASQTYSVKLIKTRYLFRTNVSGGTDTGTSNPLEGADAVGFTACTFINIDSATRSGGWSTLIDGRLIQSTLVRCFSNGGRSGHSAAGMYDFALRNSTDNTLVNCGTEGNATGGILLNNSHHNEFVNCQIPVSRPSESAWAATTAYSLGDRRVATALKNANPQATANLYFTVTTAGTSGGTEPTWTTTPGNTTTDGTVTWTASSVAAVGDCITLVGSNGNHFRGRRAYDAGSPASYRRAYVANIDANSFDNVFENYSARGIVASSTEDGSTDAANEYSLPTSDNRNYVAGHLTQSFNSYRLPYSLGSHPHRPSRTAALDFGSINAASAATLTITVNGAVTNDDVRVTPPSNLNAGMIPTAWVSANDTVTVRLYNATAGAIDPASGTYRATVLKP